MMENGKCQCQLSSRSNHPSIDAKKKRPFNRFTTVCINASTVVLSCFLLDDGRSQVEEALKCLTLSLESTVVEANRTEFAIEGMHSLFSLASSNSIRSSAASC